MSLSNFAESALKRFRKARVSALKDKRNIRASLSGLLKNSISRC
jgi:hypothetical protein